MKVDKNYSVWYDEFYKVIQKDFTSWYLFSLNYLNKQVNNNENKLLEIGCGQGKGLIWLNNKNIFREKSIYGIDTSLTAVDFVRKKLPNANIECSSVYELNNCFKGKTFDYIMMLEVIEHLDEPMVALEKIFKKLKKGGNLIISFPNYYSIPWLIVRILSEKLKKPNWIVLQPIDKIYGLLGIIKMCEMVGFKKRKVIGTNYFPPFLFKFEKPIFTDMLNRLGLSFLSFHPCIIFEKTENEYTKINS